MYHVILGQKIWSLDANFAKPATDILCERYKDERILDLIRSEHRVLQDELASAKTSYEAYLKSNGLIAVELDVDIGQGQRKTIPKPTPGHFGNVVGVFGRLFFKNMADRTKGI